MDKFRLTDTFLDKYKRQKPPFGFNGLGELVYLRTYSRVKQNGENEKWWETVQRVVEGTFNMQKRWIEQHRLGWSSQKAQKSAQEMYDRIFNMKFLPPGRGLWAMGSSLTEERGLFMSLNNCAFCSTVNIKDDLAKSFCFLMDVSMLGVGCGFDVKGEGKIIVRSPISTNSYTYVIPDTREGWVESVRLLIESYFLGTKEVIFDYSLIRKNGEPIKGFGGISSGAGPLKELHDGIRSVFAGNVDKPLTLTSIVDVMNMIGKCVVAGNVRRTAEIVFGDYKSSEYLDLKNYSINPQRAEYGWTSNNSIFCELGMDYSDSVKRTSINGEPGYAWLQNMKAYSRMNNGADNKDWRVEGGNPCLEQSLESYEVCNLVETFPCNHETLEDYLVTLKYAYLYAKTVTLGQTHWSETNRVMLRNRRIGCSMSGIAQFVVSKGIHELKTWCEEGYKKIEYYDEIYSDWLAIPKSIKKTSIKPSGCQVGSTLVITSNGLLRLDEIGNIHGKQWQEHDIEICQENTSAKSTKFYVNGIAATKKIKLSSGLELESTPNHKYRVFADGEYMWKSAEDIRIGDKIPYRLGGYIKTTPVLLNVLDWPRSALTGKILNFTKFKQPTVFNEDLSWFIGLYFADGSNHKKGLRIAGSIDHIEILEKAQKIIKEQFDIDSIIYPRTSSDNNADLYINNTGLVWWLEAHGLLKQYCENIIVPPLVRKSSQSVILQFIDGFKCGDGCRLTNGDSFVSVSKQFVTEMVVLMRSVGIDAKFREMPPTDTSYGTLMRYWVSERSGRFNENKWKYINKELREIWEKFDAADLQRLSVDVVTGIEDGEDYTYDIEVPHANTYIANSVVSHNTVSLLAGATPGVHYPEDIYYIRRMRLSKHSDLIEPLMDAGYKIEPCFGSEASTVVVEIPVKIGEQIRSVKDVSIWEQAALAAFMQRYWADNQVSCTITFKKEEASQIQPLLNYYQYQLKGISFLPYTEGGTTYKQMPYESITAKKYEELVVKLKPIKFKGIKGEEAEVEKFCSNDTCQLLPKI